MTGAPVDSTPGNFEDELMLPDHFRTTVAAVLSRYFPSDAPSPRLAERLGPGRWRIEWSTGGPGRRFDLYLARGCACALCVWVRDGGWEVTPEGDLTGDAAVNLGDCLLRAVCQGARRIVLRLRDGDAASPEAESVLSSFARSFSEDPAPVVTIQGSGPASWALFRAFRRGVKQGAISRRTPPVRARAY
ncbi:MAG: hypothetical protein AB9872_15195 [Solidesulfovibrio sp.]